MTTREKKEVVQVMTNLLFHFIHRHELKDPAFKNWTKGQFKKEIKEAIEDIAEDYGIVPCQPVIGCDPKKNEIWLSLHSVGNDALCDLDRSIPWKEFASTIIDSDPDHREWFRERFLELAEKLDGDTEIESCEALTQ